MPATSVGMVFTSDSPQNWHKKPVSMVRSLVPACFQTDHRRVYCSVCVYIYIYIYICVYICVCVYIYVCIYMCICVCLCVCVCVWSTSKMFFCFVFFMPPQVSLSSSGLLTQLSITKINMHTFTDIHVDMNIYIHCNIRTIKCIWI